MSSFNTFSEQNETNYFNGLFAYESEESIEEESSLSYFPLADSLGLDEIYCQDEIFNFDIKLVNGLRKIFYLVCWRGLNKYVLLFYYFCLYPFFYSYFLYTLWSLSSYISWESEDDINNSELIREYQEHRAWMRLIPISRTLPTCSCAECEGNPEISIPCQVAAFRNEIKD